MWENQGKYFEIKTNEKKNKTGENRKTDRYKLNIHG